MQVTANVFILRNVDFVFHFFFGGGGVRLGDQAEDGVSKLI